jgi:hypothetical protein
MERDRDEVISVLEFPLEVGDKKACSLSRHGKMTKKLEVLDEGLESPIIHTQSQTGRKVGVVTVGVVRALGDLSAAGRADRGSEVLD